MNSEAEAEELRNLAELDATLEELRKAGAIRFDYDGDTIRFEVPRTQLVRCAG